MLRLCKIAAILVMVICAVNACAPSKKAIPVAEKSIPLPSLPVIEAVVDNAKTDAFLEQLLAAKPQYFSNILSHRKEWNTQIIYTQIDRGGNGMPVLTNYYFNVDADKYFYPASTVKLPVSLLALQRLNELKEKNIDRNSAMITEAGVPGQTAVYNDPLSLDGRPTVANYIKKILSVSDNDAYNRLYEFLGQEYINDQLHKKGYTDVQLLHRLQISLSEKENRQTNPVNFLDNAGNILYQQPLRTNEVQYEKRKDSMGQGYYQGNTLINGPMDFSGKNRISLEDLHNVLISLIFPEKVSAEKRFNISEDDRRFMLKYMSQYSTESTYPPYLADTAKYWPAANKLLLFGGEKKEVPKSIRIFNKTGGAYGQLLDVAYVVDFEKGVEYFLSAVTYCNSDGIINDDKYDYQTVGQPFLKNLGKVIYDYEVSRPKKNTPNLSEFKFIYDK
jgi:beta-lactamase class A